MQSRPAPSSSRRIDENWLQQWIAFGMLEMAIYLTNRRISPPTSQSTISLPSGERVRRNPESPSISGDCAECNRSPVRAAPIPGVRRVSSHRLWDGAPRVSRPSSPVEAVSVMRLGFDSARCWLRPFR